MNKQINAVEASVLQQNKKALLLDVREKSELAICKVEGALHIPMGEIPDRCDTLAKDQTIVVFCHHGMRSQRVQDFLISKGFENVVNMQGGIHAWSLEVDPEVAKY